MIGGGQLARMTHQAAIALGQTLRVLAAAPDDPAAQVTPDVVLGAHTDIDALRRAAKGADALTFDHEHVPTGLLEQLVAEGVKVAPPPEALIHAQDKLVMRRRLETLGAPVPRFAEVTTVDDVDDFAARIDGPVVVKTVRGGYDGRGVILARDVAEARDAVERYLADGVAVLVEERVAMRRELSALVARSPFGQGAAWPIVETVQRDGICVEVIAPAPGLDPELGGAAEALGLRLAEELGVVGVLAVELFETNDGGLLVNELAMRPHNSGHWTMDGARTSQFEQHLRAVLDYPLGATGPIAPRHRDGQRARRTTGTCDQHGRTAAPSVRADARRQGAPVRQVGAARPQDRARERARRRGWLGCRRCVRGGRPGKGDAGRALPVAR